MAQNQSLNTVDLAFLGYEVIEEVGKGRIGTVYKAIQKKLNRIVAIKTIQPIIEINELFINRLGAESKKMARLQHPNILAITDFLFHKEHYYVVMEYIEGGKTLRDLISKQGAMDEKQMIDIAIALTKAWAIERRKPD